MQRTISVKVDCALSICPLDILCRGSTKNKDIPFHFAKDLNWDEEKLGFSAEELVRWFQSRLAGATERVAGCG